MEAVSDLFGVIAGSSMMIFWGGLMLYWCTDFFGFLRDMLTNDSLKVRELKAQIQALEGELTAYRRLLPETAGTQVTHSSFTGEEQKVA